MLVSVLLVLLLYFSSVYWEVSFHHSSSSVDIFPNLCIFTCLALYPSRFQDYRATEEETGRQIRWGELETISTASLIIPRPDWHQDMVANFSLRPKVRLQGANCSIGTAGQGKARHSKFWKLCLKDCSKRLEVLECPTFLSCPHVLKSWVGKISGEGLFTLEYNGTDKPITTLCLSQGVLPRGIQTLTETLCVKLGLPSSLKIRYISLAISYARFSNSLIL